MEAFMMEDSNGNVLLSQGANTVFQWSALVAKSLRVAPSEYTFHISDTEGDRMVSAAITGTGSMKSWWTERLFCLVRLSHPNLAVLSLS
eukprot:scaffold10095_cov163-Amphora_coffeaeformis.AAC.4